MPQPPFDKKAAHRWFAIELNNQSWSLIEASPKTPQERANLLHNAHASAHHWYQVGKIANHTRAECLVANAHAASGNGDAALVHARLCLKLIEAHPDEVEDWDSAFTHDALSRAFAATGNAEQAEDARRAARQHGDRIADSEERQVFDDWFANSVTAQGESSDA